MPQPIEAGSSRPAINPPYKTKSPSADSTRSAALPLVEPSGSDVGILDESDRPNAKELAELENFLAESLKENAQRVFRRDWTDFCAWCLRENERHLPASPATLARYLMHLSSFGTALYWNGAEGNLLPRPEDQPAPCRASSIRRRAAAIDRAHVAAGHNAPGQSAIVRGLQQDLRRKLGTTPRRRAAAGEAGVRELVRAADDARVQSRPHSSENRKRTVGLQALRDRALVLIGFAGSFRRAELAALRVEDFAVDKAGLRVSKRHATTSGRRLTEAERDNAGFVEIPRGQDPATCPVCALEAWWEAAGITSGAAFRAIHRGGRISASALTDRAVALIIKKLAGRAGLDPAAFAGNAMRTKRARRA